jgi:citrate lyase subunit beta-like protein
MFSVAHGLQAIDMVCLNFTQSEIVTKEAQEGAQMGYTGKQAIHPNQIQPIYAAFRPPEASIEFARRIIEENEKHQQQGAGAFSLDGKMIDMPMVKWAHNILSRI